MKHSIKLAAALLCATTAMSAAAQNRSAFFADNYTYRYQLNPALAPESNFVSMPGAGNINVGLNGNVSLTQFLYNRQIDGRSRTTTFMSPLVDASEFMSGIKDYNRSGITSRIGVLAGGFKAWGGYNTVSLNAVVNAQVRAPRAIFSFLKEGVSNRTYDISDVDAHADTYAEIALNHSRQINDRWRVGMAVKMLLGFGNIDVNLKQANLSLNDDNWSAVTEAEIHTNYKGVAYSTDVNSNTGHRYVDNIDFPGYTGVNGYGVAFDLGAEFRLNSDWTFTAAINDLGFIKWDSDLVASTNGEHTFNSSDYTLDPNDWKSTWEPMRDRLSTLYELENLGDQGSRTRTLAATMNVSAEYTLPVYRNLTFGLLNTTRIAGNLSSTDFRLAATVTPVKCFSAAINYGIGTYGSAFGWMLNYSGTGFNFFLAMDNTLGKLAKQGVPLTSNAQLSMGMNFPF